MKYLGFLDVQKIISKDFKTEKVLLNTNLYQPINSEIMHLSESYLRCTYDITYTIVPTQELRDEFYKFIIDLFKSAIVDITSSFFDNFNDEIYGLNSTNQKAKGLKHFKEICNNIFESVDPIFDSKIHHDGILHTYNLPKLKMIYDKYEAIKYVLSTTGEIIYYLCGEKDLFPDYDHLENEVIKEVIEFEAWKQITIELNSRYEFEDDLYFSNKIEYKIIYEKYKDIFLSFEAFRFTHEKIKSFEKEKKANIESLWEVLRMRKLVNKSKTNLKRYVFLEHQFKLTKIIPYVNYDHRLDFKEQLVPNYEHNNRVILFSKEWEEFLLQNILKNRL